MLSIIKHNNGNEIIGEITSENELEVTIENPFLINYFVSSHSLKPTVGLLRYIPFAREYKTTIQKSNITAIVEARKSIQSYYNVILHNYQNIIDGSIDEELFSVADEEQIEQEPSEEQKQKIYKAILESITSNNNTVKH